jgi:hypothetical protein
MKFLNILHTFYGLILPGRMHANDVLYNILWAPADKRRTRIIHSVWEKIVVAARTLDFKVID